LLSYGVFFKQEKTLKPLRCNGFVVFTRAFEMWQIIVTNNEESMLFVSAKTWVFLRNKEIKMRYAIVT